MSLEKERVEALQRVIDELRDEPGALMPIENSAGVTTPALFVMRK